MISTFRASNKSNYGLSCEKCRIDKKKCDKKEPICSRCIKLQTECRVYPRSTKSVKGLKLSIQCTEVNRHNSEMVNLLKPASIIVNKTILSPYPPMSNTLNYSKIMSLLSFSLDMMAKNDIVQYALLPLDSIDHTLDPLFWDMLVRLYLKELHPNFIIFSLNYFDINTCWLRACCVYLCAYDFCKIRNSITDIKMKALEILVLQELNHAYPSLKVIQCYLILTHMYVYRGDKKLKRHCYTKAVRICELIGLPRSHNSKSKLANYERSLAYIKILQFHIAILEYNNGEGMIYEVVEIEDINWEFQLVNPLQYSYEDFILANSINTTAMFLYNAIARVLIPIKLILKWGKIDTTKILEFKIILDQFYKDHVKQLGASCLDLSLFKIKETYFVIKIQIYSLLVNQYNKEEYILNWIQLNYDILHFSLSLTGKNEFSGDWDYRERELDLINFKCQALEVGFSYCIGFSDRGFKYLVATNCLSSVDNVFYGYVVLNY
ncbi:hypothetical protein CONCODRAFT_8474 [Conidiobolus coronatus NRRL 28638]|uniref:Zn(2)-C6 fungal-type domain-containing protein n=1 Tax=Conidiobolus coronatus (strain ATCC 28846 / CBS 209.66 / NRRL 28638) TaxID=796925 RepID=A0A137P261_CONC2|nr:hypothetical protein CONCODRAFT_8474 [Conidiobolus coronatus NRRL 28638]|eukprot:KXN69136.1 hypothetical protein CONCODRAFT_8474 [Conidiobolus coronatus NRRL 28638]